MWHRRLSGICRSVVTTSVSSSARISVTVRRKINNVRPSANSSTSPVHVSWDRFVQAYRPSGRAYRMLPSSTHAHGV